MKIPKPKRLQEWYRRMLDKAMCDNVIFDYKVGLTCYYMREYPFDLMLAVDM